MSAVRSTVRQLCIVFLIMLPHYAAAKSVDRDQPIKVSSKTASGSGGPNTKSILTGQVKITQGTFLATGEQAEIYTDSESAVFRVVLTGNRAHVEQLADDGTLSEADADKIDYALDTSKVVLTGHATTNKQGSGTTAAPKITYNVVDSTFFAEGTPTEMVNLTFPAKKKAGEGAAARRPD